MTGLRALLASRRVLAAPRRTARRIGARRLRGVTRRALDLTLELCDPLLLPRDRRRQRLHLRLKPLVLRRQREQHLDHGIATPLIDRLGLGTLHATGIRRPSVMSPRPTERLPQFAGRQPAV